MKSLNSRRHFVKNTAAGLSLLSLPVLLHSHPATPGEKKKIVCLGGHPDDPESGCGGTLAKLRHAGHEVTIIYLTTGESGIEGKSHDEAAAIRKQESLNACKILGVNAVFAGQIDGATIVNKDWYSRMQLLIANENPDILFGQWPVDSHKDHQAAGLFAIQAWFNASQKFALYFFEVCTGEQTMIFHPTDYVDITNTQEQKRQALYCHISQDPAGIYNCGHTAMEDFRGRELGSHAAEAFIRMNGREMGGEIG